MFGVDDILLATLITAGASAFSANSAAKGQKNANQMSQDSAREQMAFQERMSNTSHQREVADLRASGLNPVLSANSGASSPGGAMGSFQSTQAVSAPLKAEAATKGINSARAIADINNINASTKTQQTQQDLNNANARLANANAAVTTGGKLGFPGGTSIPLSTIKRGAGNTWNSAKSAILKIHPRKRS